MKSNKLIYYKMYCGVMVHVLNGNIWNIPCHLQDTSKNIMVHAPKNHAITLVPCSKRNSDVSYLA